MTAIVGTHRVEAVRLRNATGHTETRPAQLVVHAPEQLTPIASGLALSPSGHLVHDNGVVTGSCHEFVLGGGSPARSDIGGQVVSPEMVAARVLKTLTSSSRAPWSHLDPADWLRVRYPEMHAVREFEYSELWVDQLSQSAPQDLKANEAAPVCR
ncbi:hypothetical protein Z045_22630 [Rhodococcus pyridinivorans KG-16]|uniref:Uncharacterized protein n=1 Tax=Rhodococcus pyridinivorans KG-16 TaxID=1441730 RepID=A0A0V9UF04_9NOCA|nr:hypothetical protein Z045_22630 [Rhodococcus pyridinivorans KG-16]